MLAKFSGSAAEIRQELYTKHRGNLHNISELASALPILYLILTITITITNLHLKCF